MPIDANSNLKKKEGFPLHKGNLPNTPRNILFRRGIYSKKA